MKCICNKYTTNVDFSIFQKAEKEFSISIREEIMEFYVQNAGGYPIKNIIEFEGEEFEIRVFLSLDKLDNEYCAEKPINDFLCRTHGKIIPLGIDSEDNYYCINNETGKIYYWSSEVDKYYYIAPDIETFTNHF